MFSSYIYVNALSAILFEGNAGSLQCRIPQHTHSSNIFGLIVLVPLFRTYLNDYYIDMDEIFATGWYAEKQIITIRFILDMQEVIEEKINECTVYEFYIWEQQIIANLICFSQTNCTWARICDIYNFCWRDGDFTPFNVFIARLTDTFYV